MDVGIILEREGARMTPGLPAVTETQKERSMEEVGGQRRRRPSFLCTPSLTIHPRASSRIVTMARPVPM